MNGISLLIIEDNDAMRDGMSQILKKAGYPVAEARSGREGLAVLEKRAADLVITD